MKILYLILFFTFISSNVFSIESETHFWYNHGYFTNSINSLRKELRESSSYSKKSRIYYDIAYSFYGMYFVEDYKKQLDSANYFASKKRDFSIEDKVEYAIGLMRYYNYEVKPIRSIAIFNKVYPEFHKKDPSRTSKLWIKLYQNLANAHRNMNLDFSVLNTDFDSAYLLLQKHHLQNTMYEIDYCRSRGNVNLDRVNLTSNDLYYEQSIFYFSKAIHILKNKKRLNLPAISSFYNLLGLVSYMKGELEVSNTYFDSAYATLLKIKNYNDKDFQGVSLNTFNLSTLTKNLLFKKTRNFQLIKDQLKKIKSVIEKYETYSKKNVDIDLLVFTDMYGYSPYNAIVSCYNNLYFESKNKKYLDSSFYYSELNRTQWVKKLISYQSFYKKLNHFYSQNYVLVQYGEYGIVHDKYAYVLVKSKSSTNFISLGKINDLNLEKLNFENWDSTSYDKSLEVYQRFFKPIEKYILKNTTKVLITKSAFLDKVAIESLVTKAVKKNHKIPFLIYKFPVFTQPSFRIYSISSNDLVQSVSTIFPNYKGIENVSKIHFTKDEFLLWIKKNNLNKTSYVSKSGDMLMIAAHGFPGNHRVDNAYIDKGVQQLSIKSICKRNTKNKHTVLAVCDGGSGQTISSGSSFSIASAFLFSGSKSCVYSEWKLEDQVGAILFNNYLNRLANGEQKDWALRNAKLDYLQSLGNEDGSNPVYWSGLQVMGDVSPLTFENDLNLVWKIIIASILIVSLVIFLRLKIKK